MIEIIMGIMKSQSITTVDVVAVVVLVMCLTYLVYDKKNCSK